MVDAVIKECDELQLQGAVPKMFETLSNAMKENGTNVDIMWRFARACYESAEEKQDKAWKEDHFKKGLEVANKAVDLEPKSGKAHKWAGILLSKMGDFVSTKEKIGNAFIIKEHWQTALQSDDNDATLHHCLGAWCWNVANVGWIEKKAASVLFATPPDSSYEEAEPYYLKASEIDPTFVDNAFALGELYEAMKRKEDAKAWYSKCAALSAKNEKEKRVVKDAAAKAAAL